MSAQPILDVRMRALQLAYALVRGREVELHNIGKLPNDASWWQYSQEIEDQRIAELQLLCEGIDRRFESLCSHR
jgi:hypothetical protein